MDKNYFRIKSKGIIILTLIAFLVCDVSGLSIPEYGRRVINRDIIHNSGLTRIGDILLLIPEWTINTTDGFTWRTSINGLSSFQDQHWILLLNGQKVNLRTYDTINLNMLPLSLTSIDSIEIFSVPLLTHGEFSDRGLIHIHTSKSLKGTSFQAKLLAGNETGDPGPYVYTDQKTFNVDKIAYDQYLTVSAGNSNWYARTHFAHLLHTFRDFSNWKRLQTVLPDWPGLHHYSTSIQFGRNGNRSTHDILLFYSNNDEYMMFLKPYGSELPVDQTIFHAGISGTQDNKNSNLIYSFVYSQNRIAKHANTFGFNPDWLSMSYTAQLENQVHASKLDYSYGISAERFNLVTKYSVSNNNQNLFNIFSRIKKKPTDYLFHSYDFKIGTDGNQIAFKGSFLYHRILTSFSSFEARLSVSQRLNAENMNIWNWIDQGYNVFSNNDIQFEINRSNKKNINYTMDINWHWEKNKDQQLDITALFREINQGPVEIYDYSFDSEGCSFKSPAEIHELITGNTFGVNIIISDQFNKFIGHRLFYGYLKAVSGEAEFIEIWKSIPVHKIIYTINYVPVPNFSLWFMARYLGPTVWSDFSNIDGATCSFPSSTKPVYNHKEKQHLIIDLQAKKWFWKRQFTASMILRNLLNQDFRYYPIGINMKLSFFIQLEMIIE